MYFIRQHKFTNIQHINSIVLIFLVHIKHMRLCIKISNPPIWFNCDYKISFNLDCCRMVPDEKGTDTPKKTRLSLSLILPSKKTFHSNHTGRSLPRLSPGSRFSPRFPLPRAVPKALKTRGNRGVQSIRFGKESHLY